MKKLSDQLSALADRTKQTEDTVAAARAKDRARLEAQRDTLKASAAAKLDAAKKFASFIASPEIVIAYGLAGRLSFNPLTDPLEAPDGTMWMLEPPAAAPDLPA